VTLAEPGSFIRPFLDLGPDMAELLHRMTSHTGTTGNVKKILAAFSKDSPAAVADPIGQSAAITTHSMPDQPALLVRRSSKSEVGSPVKGSLVDESFPPSPQSVLAPLTNREIHILDLLSQRMSNKEIAHRLSISPQTVKRHTANLYKKLDVSDRRQAVERAGVLDILAGG